MRNSFNLLRGSFAHEIHVLVFKDLRLLERCKDLIVVFEGHCSTDR